MEVEKVRTEIHFFGYNEADAMYYPLRLTRNKAVVAEMSPEGLEAVANACAQKIAGKSALPPAETPLQSLTNGLKCWEGKDENKLVAGMAFMMLAGDLERFSGTRDEWRSNVRQFVSQIGDAFMAAWEEKHG